MPKSILQIIAILIVISLYSCNNKAGKQIIYHDQVVGYTDTLYIDFQSGFANDTVNIFINGEISDYAILTTDIRIGFADQFVYSKVGIENIQLEFKNRNNLILTLEKIEKNFLGIELIDDSVNYTFKDNIFHYE